MILVSKGRGAASVSGPVVAGERVGTAEQFAISAVKGRGMRNKREPKGAPILSNREGVGRNATVL